MNEVENLIEFLKEAEKLSQIKRMTLLSNGEQESDSEHSYQMILILMVLEKYLPKNLNYQKINKMIVLHDLPEIYSGDLAFFDQAGRKEKQASELDSAKKLFSKLPSDLETEFLELFAEYDQGITQESKIAKAIDKIQPVIQEILVEAKVSNEHNLGYNRINDLKKKYILQNPVIKELYEKLMFELKPFLKKE